MPVATRCSHRSDPITLASDKCRSEDKPARHKADVTHRHSRTAQVGTSVGTLPRLEQEMRW